MAIEFDFQRAFESVHERLNDISNDQAEARTHLKNLLGNGQPGLCAQHSDRIARLERWRAWLTGALAVLGLLWTATVTVFAALVVERIKR